MVNGNDPLLWICVFVSYWLGSPLQMENPRWLLWWWGLRLFSSAFLLPNDRELSADHADFKFFYSAWWLFGILLWICFYAFGSVWWELLHFGVREKRFTQHCECLTPHNPCLWDFVSIMNMVVGLSNGIEGKWKGKWKVKVVFSFGSCLG